MRDRAWRRWGAIYLIGVVLGALVSDQLWAAACCGGGLATPGLILSDDKAQATIAYQYLHERVDVDADSLWRKRTGRDLRQTLRLSAAHLVADRWQIGGRLPLQTRSVEGRQAQGIGDLAVNVGYEALLEESYSWWRPRAWVFAQVDLPTGESIYEAGGEAERATGRGFVTPGLGVAFTKVSGIWDGFMIAALFHSLQRSFDIEGRTARAEPGWGGALTLGFGLSRDRWRYGVSSLWNYEDPLKIRGEFPSSGSAQRQATLGLSLSFNFGTQDSIQLEYFDQTLLGAPVTTVLGRGALVSFQRRWLR